MPVSFKIHDDNRYHPVAWTKHPDLQAIVFSDGTTSLVNPDPSAGISSREPRDARRETTAGGQLDQPDGKDNPDLTPFLSGAPTPTWVKPTLATAANTLGGAAFTTEPVETGDTGDFAEILRLDDAFDELTDAVVEDVTGAQWVRDPDGNTYTVVTGDEVTKFLAGESELDETGKRLAQRFKPEGFA